MKLNDIYNFDYLKNATEEIVKDILAEEMEHDKSICNCDDCVIDIVAIALNNLKPRYTTSLKGNIYVTAKADIEYMKAARDAIKYSVEKIKANPSH